MKACSKREAAGWWEKLRQWRWLNRAQKPAGMALATSRLPSATGRWREQYNPLRGLTLESATRLLEAYPRGEMADLQWAYYFIEETDPDLFALVERRSSALLEMDWRIKMVNDKEMPQGEYDPALAREQATALREAYERIENIYEAIEHLSLASFRGYAHLEKHRDAAGQTRRLEILDQWNVVRDGLTGGWKYNPEARPTAFNKLPEAWRLDPAQWIIREVKRHINRVALVKYARANLAQKDWDAYVEIYGLPGAVIFGPPNVPPEQEEAYAQQAAQVAEGSSAYLPNGSAIQFFNGPRLASPYHDYLRYLAEQLVLAGTGGILNMLTESGSGTLAGSVHAQAFAQIARAEARKISELLQRQFDAELLSAGFPGRPRLAYFEMAANEKVDLGVAVEHAVKLRAAGLDMDPGQLSEITGYRLKPMEPNL